MTVLRADKYTLRLEIALKYNRVRTAEGKVTQHRAGFVEETQRLLLFGCPRLDPSLARFDEQLSVGARAAVCHRSPSEVKCSGWVSPSFGDVAEA